jgi:hypothetical protein
MSPKVRKNNGYLFPKMTFMHVFPLTGGESLRHRTDNSRRSAYQSREIKCQYGTRLDLPIKFGVARDGMQLHKAQPRAPWVKPLSKTPATVSFILARLWGFLLLFYSTKSIVGNAV